MTLLLKPFHSESCSRFEVNSLVSHLSVSECEMSRSQLIKRNCFIPQSSQLRIMRKKRFHSSLRTFFSNRILPSDVKMRSLEFLISRDKTVNLL
jgi:hypothetical protein